MDEITKEYKEGYQDGYDEAICEVKRLLDKCYEAPEDQEPAFPRPCVRGIDMRTMKAIFLKLDEELEEFKFAFQGAMNYLEDRPEDVQKVLADLPEEYSFRIAEEGADFATVIATAIHAVGIGDEMRFDAQRHVNRHNRERGRL